MDHQSLNDSTFVVNYDLLNILSPLETYFSEKNSFNMNVY